VARSAAMIREAHFSRLSAQMQRVALCCLRGYVDTNGICCPSGYVNCNGTCCGGSCSGGVCMQTLAGCKAQGFVSNCSPQLSCPDSGRLECVAPPGARIEHATRVFLFSG
jgi:hypothetical protein